MRKTLSFCLATAAIFLAGCSTDMTTSENKLKVVTSFYPLTEIVQKVGGNLVQVKNLTPAGAEPHDYEPTPQDIVALHKAQLVLINGAGFEAWADSILPELEKTGVVVLDVSKTFQKGALPPQDPHIWLDPVQYLEEVSLVAQKLEQLDSSHKDTYEQNAQKFIQQLQDLDKLYAQGLKNCKYRSFVANHAAFGYLSKRYNLEMISISGLSPDSEPSAKTLTDLTDLIKKKELKYILVETLVSPKIAETLANEVGAQTLVLNPLEGLTDYQIAQGKDYLAVMKDNLKNLQTALQCE